MGRVYIYDWEQLTEEMHDRELHCLVSNTDVMAPIRPYHVAAMFWSGYKISMHHMDDTNTLVWAEEA